MEILGNGKYRNEKIKLSTTPKFTETTTKEELVKKIKQMFTEIEEISGSNDPFKYK